MNRRTLFTIALILVGSAFASANPLMPGFDTVPNGWYTDRYAPTSFSDIGNFQGRTNVLGISITSAGAFNNRPGGEQSTFYNTQGDGYNVSGGAGSTLDADLYIPQSWSDAANGSVRTDMWGVMTDGTGVSDYPIIGFTNYGGVARIRVWDEDLGNWVDLSTAIAYDQWNSFQIAFTGASYVYSVNGVAVFTDNTIDGSVAFQEVIMQAYNFGGDPSLVGANPVDYQANWSNSVPEPTTMLLLGSGLIAIGRRFARRKL